MRSVLVATIALLALVVPLVLTAAVPFAVQGPASLLFLGAAMLAVSLLPRRQIERGEGKKGNSAPRAVPRHP
jgi:hypothetical protein